MEKITYPRIGETVRRCRLSNGLTVCFVPRKDFRRQYAILAVGYGGMDLRFGRGREWQDTPAGIAHYLEHKMFDTQEGSALQDLARNGAEPNAFTGCTMTAYYFDCAANFTQNLRTLLSFVSVPYFTDESVEKERGIIAQEIAMVEDDPDWVVYQNLLEALYANTPARISVAGTVESIGAITAPLLYDCHRTFYTPSNMCLVVVGDVDEPAVLRLVEEVLPAVDGEPVCRDYGGAETLTPVKKEVSCRMELSMPTFLAGFKCPPVAEGEDRLRRTLVGELACDVLLGDSSPLFARLYSQGLVNGSFGSSYDLLPGIACVTVGGDAQDPQRVMAEVLAEARRLVAEGIDPDYFRRILRANFGTTLKGLNSFENVAVSMAEGHFEGYDPYRFPEAYDAITRQDLLDFIRENICESRMALSVIYPKEEQEICTL